MKKTFCKKTFIFIILCLATFGIGWYIRGIPPPARPTNRPDEIREDTTSYHYINPLLLVNFPRPSAEFNTLNKKISDYATQSKNKGNASSISVYFQDINSGRWTGVNEDELYAPSSMLKVAVMIGYLNAADDDPEILQKKLNYVASDNTGQYYKPVYPLASGSYSVEQLIEAMIIDSDNTALELLYNNNRDVFINVLKELNIPPPASMNDLDFMSPKTYSKMFRTLYSATYLSRDLSEAALKLLASTTFKNGLVAGTPTTTPIAHKFGEHTTISNNVVTSHELHDCGIVYYPGKPYFLCVMTKGSDFKKLESVISDISKITYENIP